jgi:hypothetical protein
VEILLELIFEIFGEFILQFLAELLIDVGIRSISKPFSTPKGRNPVAAFFGYCLIGGIAGGFSLVVRASPFIHHPDARVVNLIVTPVLTGLAMYGTSALRTKRGKSNSGLERFLYAWAFAMAFALARFLWTLA